MPKIKTNRGAEKRFRPMSNGRFKCKQSFKNHILTKKSSKRKRQLGSMDVVDVADTPAVRRMVPYA